MGDQKSPWVFSATMAVADLDDLGVIPPTNQEWIDHQMY